MNLALAPQPGAADANVSAAPEEAAIIDKAIRLKSAITPPQFYRLPCCSFRPDATGLRPHESLSAITHKSVS
jgi:hypothetical protein